MRRRTITDSSIDCNQQKSKAPLVDSTLLRFLSSQKNGAQAPTNASKGQPKLKRALANAISEEEIVIEVEVPPIAETSLAAETDQTTTRVAIKDQSQKIIESQSWLSQYNAQKVALKLQAHGVDESTSFNTGKVVQDYVLARVTRRRIRKFLQERDASWEAGNPLPLDKNGMQENMPLTTTSMYNLDSVISVMLEYGLTGNDISAVLSHTPSVAMMRARQNTNHTENTAQTQADRKGFTLAEALNNAFVGLLGNTLKLRRYDARKVRIGCVPCFT